MSEKYSVELMRIMIDDDSWRKDKKDKEKKEREYRMTGLMKIEEE